MSVKNTLFGLLYLPHLTKCGCIKYNCNQCKNSKKTFKEMNNYTEMFYLDNDYIGKFKYKYKSNVELESRIQIYSHNFSVRYHEFFSTIKSPYYSLKLNSYPIHFYDLPSDLIEILQKKNIILPK